ncbi:hypothetical protein [Sphaerotilus microaerophilus]|uniref:Uncharacterized protein n=1 Tax=Sphaerotilus microaerophilus TaxID=2914710 RepID=A0ABN6PS56_9BURK|nr:hypothetical protein [Sphaerotilus sp. FB-5]BDI07463.1 hypothetical protein CATMQ487_44330 [Sphaerotilus sp. FB-5]
MNKQLLDEQLAEVAAGKRTRVESGLQVSVAKEISEKEERDRAGANAAIRSAKHLEGIKQIIERNNENAIEHHRHMEQLQLDGNENLLKIGENIERVGRERNQIIEHAARAKERDRRESLNLNRQALEITKKSAYEELLRKSPSFLSALRLKELLDLEMAASEWRELERLHLGYISIAEGLESSIRKNIAASEEKRSAEKEMLDRIHAKATQESNKIHTNLNDCKIELYRNRITLSPISWFGGYAERRSELRFRTYAGSLQLAQ